MKRKQLRNNGNKIKLVKNKWNKNSKNKLLMDGISRNNMSLIFLVCKMNTSKKFDFFH